MPISVRDATTRYRLRRSLYADDIGDFLARSPQTVLGTLAESTGFEVGIEQRGAWLAQIDLLHTALQGLQGLGRMAIYVTPQAAGNTTSSTAAAGNGSSSCSASATLRTRTGCC